MGKTNWPELRCPFHQSSLNDRGDTLDCPDGDKFPRIGGIPRFVTHSNYADAFGEQWKRYRLIQLDSYSKTTITRERALRCLGHELQTTIVGKHVLECGCGAGRFTEILLSLGGLVTSVDLSSAVEANQENCPQTDTHRIIQADIMKLPFATMQYDVVFCLGVIQHTPVPETTIEQLYSQVKPGGALVIDHYTHSLSWYTKTAQLFRQYAKRLPPDKGIRWTEQLVEWFFPLHKRVRHFRVGQMLLSRVSPVLCYWHAFPELSDDQQMEWALVDTHDSLTAWYRHRRTRGQIKRGLQRLGIDKIYCEYGGNGIEARGFRPSR